MRGGATMNHALPPRFFSVFAVIGVGAIRGGGALLSGYSREKSAASRCTLTACMLFFLTGIAAAQQPEVQFLRSWQADKSVPFADLSGLAVRSDGTVLFVERERGALWRIAGDAITSIELAGKDRPFEAKKLGGVAWLGEDRYAIVNTRNDLLAIVDGQGKLEQVFASSGKSDGELDDPQGITFSPQKRLYVADQGNNRVVVLSEHGVFLHSICLGKDPAIALAKPAQVAVDGWERVYVLEPSGSGRVSIYDRTGRPIKRLTPETTAMQDARWRALTVDLAGRVFVADERNKNIAEIDWEKGRVVRRFGSPGQGRGQFAEIAALAISGRDLVVADIGNRKIEFFRVPEGAPATAAVEVERLPSARRTSAATVDCERVYAFLGGDLLCLDREKNRVALLDASGALKSAFPGKLERPRRAAFDAKDIAIADGDTVKIFAHDGTQKFAVGRGGSRDGEFSDIGGLYLADYLYVADTGNHRVQIFTRDGILVNKIVDAADAKQRRIARPVAVVTDAAHNIYVADGETNPIQVYAPSREWRETLGATRGYEAIHGMAVDSDNRVYVLASTDRAKQLVDVYRGNELDFSFAAYRAPKIEATREATLSIPLAGLDIALHDAGRKQLAIYHYLQSPQRLGGVEVRGGPAKVRVAWRKSPERFVGAYRVYAAADKDGPYARLVETKESEASFDVDPAKPLTHYRVAAQSRLDVEGDPSAAVEDLFRAAYRLYEGGKLDAALGGFEP